MSLYYKVGRTEFLKESRIMNKPDNSHAIVGIDMSKKKFDVALLRNDKFKHKVFPNTASGHREVIAWLHKNKVEVAHLCMESTNIYGEALAGHLHDQGYTVSIVNPARIKGFAQSELARTKTDKADASLIARFCLAMDPTPWQPDAVEIRELKALVRRLEALMGMRQQEVNRLHVAPEIILADVEAHIAYLDDEIKETKKRIRDHIDHHPDLKEKKTLLESIPGIGEATIAIILSEFAQIDRFRNAKCLAAYIGVAPRERQSGSSVRGRTMMSKTGRSQLRKAFFMPALVALRYNPILMAMKQRLTDAGKPKMAIVGAAMRKLVHLIYGVLKSGVPFDPNYVSKRVDG
jgi:transposase